MSRRVSDAAIEQLINGLIAHGYRRGEDILPVTDEELPHPVFDAPGGCILPITDDDGNKLPD